MSLYNDLNEILTPYANKIKELNGSLDDIKLGVLSDDVKTALLNCFAHVSWSNENDKQYYTALRKALLGSERREELPNTYEQVEYIKGTGTQYIVTDVNSQIPFKAELKASVSDLDTNILCSGTPDVSNSRFYVFAVSNQPQRMWLNRFGSEIWYGDSSSIVEFDTVYNVISSITSTGSNQVKTYIKYDESYSEKIISTPTSALGYPLHIFRMPQGYSNSRYTKLYAIKFYSGSTLLFDGIPCYRKSDNKTGLYDAVSETFYPNSGTGEFVIGDIVS